MKRNPFVRILPRMTPAMWAERERAAALGRKDGPATGADSGSEPPRLPGPALTTPKQPEPITEMVKGKFAKPTAPWRWPTVKDAAIIASIIAVIGLLDIQGPYNPYRGVLAYVLNGKLKLFGISYTSLLIGAVIFVAVCWYGHKRQVPPQ